MEVLQGLRHSGRVSWSGISTFGYSLLKMNRFVASLWPEYPQIKSEGGSFQLHCTVCNLFVQPKTEETTSRLNCRGALLSSSLSFAESPMIPQRWYAASPHTSCHFSTYIHWLSFHLSSTRRLPFPGPRNTQQLSLRIPAQQATMVNAEQCLLSHAASQCAH